MAIAWTSEWLAKQQKACQADDHFNDDSEGFDRFFVMHVLADPERGVPADRWVGFNPPQMDDFWVSDSNERPDSDYIVRGTYADWHAINEGRKGLVASLLDQSIELIAGNTSYIAMFVAGADRFYEISRSVTDSYEGDFKREG
jgi:hypothetical protein